MTQPVRRELRMVALLVYAHAGLAAVFCLTSLYVLAVVRWTTIYSDQWRILNEYLALGFPANVLSLQNGHRPIIPGLFYLADYHLFGAQNRFLSLVGIALALAVATAWSSLILREQRLDKSTKLLMAAGVWIWIIWLANGRVLAHGNESVPIYLVMLSLLLALLTLEGDSRRPGKLMPRLLLASALALVATFSFGFGIATWIAVAAGAALMRLPVRAPLVLIAGFAAAIGIYVWILPGTVGGAGILSIAPLASASNFVTWLGAPAYHGALALPGIDRGSFGLAPATAAGAVGVAAALILIAHGWRDRRATGTESAHLAILVFGLACGAMVAITRGDYFAVHPEQVVAPRYLPWVCLFWSALLGLLSLHAMRATRRRVVGRLVWPCLLGLLYLAMIPAHNGRNLEWAKYLMDDASIGLAVGLRVDSRIGVHLHNRLGDVYSLTARMAETGAGIYSWSALETLGRRFEGSPGMISSCGVEARAPLLEVLHDESQSAAHFVGTLPVDGRCEFTSVLVVDERGLVVGVGRVATDGHRLARRLRLLTPVAPRYFGYLRDYRAGVGYSILGSSPDRTTYSVLSRIPARAEAEGDVK